MEPVRVIVFYFKDNILVGHEFCSSFKKDTTYFDPAKVNEIKKGETTLNQTIELLGNRYGECIYPLVKNKDEKGLTYLYAQTEKGFLSNEFHSQSLVVIVNKQGIVTEVEFSSSGQMKNLEEIKPNKL